MLKNYLVIAYRNLLRHKVFSLINILGLAIGMAVCLLIFQFVSFEVSYDQFHKYKSDIYRIRLDRYDKGELSTQWAGGSAAVGHATKANFPEVLSHSVLHSLQGVISYDNREFREENIFWASDSTLVLFSFPLLEGDPKTALVEPYSVVITESAAKKYFGDEPAMGKSLEVNGRTLHKVTGVLKDIPENSHLQFDMLFAMATWVKLDGEDVMTAWQWDGFLSYIRVKPGTDPEVLADKIDELALNEQKDYLAQANHRMDFSLQPITDIHLYSNYLVEASTNGDGESVFFLGIIAIIVLIIAWVNYINLSTARSVDRAREVGLRKTTGASKQQLITQFLFESFLINLLASGIALTIFQAARGWLANLTDIPDSYSLWAKPEFWIAFAAMLLIGSVLAGLYPAFVLSSFKPVQVLKGNMGQIGKTGFGAITFRKGLVVLQFAISVALIVGTLAVREQISFMANYDLGLSVDQILVVRGPGISDSTYGEKILAYEAELLQNPNISQFALSTHIPGNRANNAGGIRVLGEAEAESKQYGFLWANNGFLDLYDIELVEGRKFAPETWRDTNTVIFNEAAVTHLGFSSPEEVIGQKIEFWGTTPTVIGVVKNFHLRSLREDFRPTIIRYYPMLSSYQSLKISTKNLQETIAYAEEQYQRFFPGNPFEHVFADEYFNRQYQTDQQFGKVFGIFTILAILVACLGLFGLASFTIVKRTKEIGIRKVLGASVSQIMFLLSKEFLLLVMISNLVALPLAYWGITVWLENFSVRMEMSAILFLIPFIIVVFIAWMTISIQTLKTANANPAKSLRYE
ncbi:MAG: ABC transporter permease [Bacteroidetes bacterium]|nr:ABC transporter permease [Bacteroidota bacterium]